MSADSLTSNPISPILTDALRDLIEEVSGVGVATGQEQLTFLDLGLDSLVLTQLASVLQRRYKMQLSFRQLIEDVTSLQLLAEYVGTNASPATLPQQPPTASVLAGKGPNGSSQPAVSAALPQVSFPSLPLGRLPAAPGGDGVVGGVIAQQLQIMLQQLDLLRGGNGLAAQAPALTEQYPAQGSAAFQGTAAPRAESSDTAASPAVPSESAAPPSAPAKPFGPQVRIDLTTTGAELSPRQVAFIAELCQQYCARTKGSKAFTAKNRALLADPRVVSGFKPVYKEMVYPIVVERSSGAKLWDVDGNQYVDITCGFGANFFGHTPDWVVEAVTEQLRKGMEIGPQTPLAAEVATLIQELTGFERVAFCNTGSEAVLGATRVCRTVTGRPLVVMFENDYHGIFDEVVVRGSKSLRSRPAAAGVLPEAVQNTLILEYGAPESLDILKSRIEDVAAVLVEPVQGRRPELQPREFLHSLRALTQDAGVPLIFDEVITGFRIALGGAQEYFGVRADLATYGKVVGAGMPMGIIAGKAKYMDALDGGAWQYGDSSAPSVGVTYFAGTFVRHPPALAASRAALKRLKEDGGQIQRRLNARTDLFASELNSFFEQVGAPVRIKNFGSLCKIWVADEERHASLLFFELRHRGVHAWEGRPAFLTLGHTEEDIAFVCEAFKASVSELIRMGLLSGDVNALAALPPTPGAKLGKDQQGNPAWYIADPERPGKYLKVETRDNGEHFRDADPA